MKYNILILGNWNFSNKQIVKHIEKRGHTAKVVSPNSIILNFGRYGTSTMFVDDDEFKPTTFHAVIPRIGKNFAYGCAVLEFLTETMGLYSTATADGLRTASDKFRSSIALARAGVACPRTTSVRVPDNFQFLIDSVGGLPVISKNFSGSQGAGVNIFVDKLQSSIALKNMRNEKKSVLLQEFIETAKDDERKSDLRVHVVGSKVVCAYRRMSMDDDFRSNYSLSKQGEKVKLTAAQEKLSIAAAQAVGLTYAGVDIAVNADTGKSFVLEVNGNSSLSGITKITKHEVGGDLAEHTISELEKGLIEEIEGEVAKQVVRHLDAQKELSVLSLQDTFEDKLYLVASKKLRPKMMQSVDSLAHLKVEMNKKGNIEDLNRFCVRVYNKATT